MHAKADAHFYLPVDVPDKRHYELLTHRLRQYVVPAKLSSCV